MTSPEIKATLRLIYYLKKHDVMELFMEFAQSCWTNSSFYFTLWKAIFALFNKGRRIASFKFSGIAPLESNIFTMRVMTGSRTSRHVLQQPYGNGVKVTVITCRLLDVMLDLFVTDLFTFRQTTDTVYPTAPYTRWHSTYNKHRLLHSVSEYGIRYFHISEHFQFSE